MNQFDPLCSTPHSRAARLRALLILIASVIATVVASTQVLAQQAPTPGGTATTPDTGRLEPVIVTATRVPYDQAVATASTSVVTGADLQARGIISVADALRDVAGADIVQTGSIGGLTSLFLRGGESDYTKVLLDGVPLNVPGGAFFFQNLTTADIDRIEVVRGPTSVLYGSDAVSGVIQIFTKQGDGAPQGTIDVRGGNYKTVDGSANIEGSAGILGYSLGGTRETTSGILPFNNGLTNGELGGRIDVGRGSATSAALIMRYHTADYHFPTISDGTPVDHNQHRRDEGTTAMIKAGHVFSPVVDAGLELSANNEDAANINPQDGPADTVGTLSTYSRDVFQRLGADGHINAHIGRAAVATVGGHVEGQTDRTRSLDVFNFGGLDTSATAPTSYFRRVGAAYAQILGNIDNVASYSAGARVDDNSAFGTFGTYRLGAGYAPGLGARFHAELGTAFKEPTFEQNFSRASSDVGNPSLRPEHSLGWEVGVVESPIGPDLALSATYFNQRFQNIVDYSFVGFPLPGHVADSTNYINIAGATADGIELGFTAGPVDHTSIELTYTGLDTRVTSNGVDTTGYSQFRIGTRLIRRPSHQFSGTVRYALALRGSLSTTVRFVGTRDDIDFNALSGAAARVVLPGYTVVDFSGEYRLVGAQGGRAGFSLIARVANLLGRTYQEVYTFAAPGRVVLVGGRIEAVTR